MTMLSKQQSAIITLPNRPSQNATLVAKFEKGKVPDRSEVKKFYGDNAPKSAYGPTSSDRLVFKRENGSYVIIPDTRQNIYLWKLV